jgi:DNA-binding PadR family transcriptional regulator
VSVRNALLALLEEGPRYGYQLRQDFEQRTGGTWPLNVGQVYTTLARLERDGLVEGRGADAEGHVVYAVTVAGRDEVASWFTSPVPRTQPPREELAIKLALAVSIDGVDVGTVIQQQRGATMSAMQDYTRLKRRDTGQDPRELGWSLVLDSLIFAAEAEIRRLDHCEARLRRAALEAPSVEKDVLETPLVEEGALVSPLVEEGALRPSRNHGAVETTEPTR